MSKQQEARIRRGFALAVEECQMEQDWENAADALYHLALEYQKDGRGAFMEDNGDLAERGALEEAWKAVRLEMDPGSAVGRVERWYEAWWKSSAL